MKSNATKIFVLVLIFALGLVFSATPVRAQVSGATLSGTITDAQGGAVVGAKISARNAATGVSTDTTTNSSGIYSIVNLLPANYDVSVSAMGFRTAVSKVTLTVGAKQEMNVSLTVGEVSQTVEVTGAAPVIETTNATLSGNVESAQIVELPLNGRDWASLATLEPGVATVRPHEAVDAPGGETRGLGMQMTVDGNRPQQNVYRLNGVIVNDYSNAGPGNVLGANMGVDAIQEFTVLTSNYSAEYGFTSGGVINAVTKSGTNSFHGSAYEFVRNSAFDAADFFENANGEKKGAFTRNQFGASAGWKVLKDRAFLFGDYEGLRQVKAIPQTAQTLSTNARLGIVNDACGNLPGTGYANANAFTNCTPTSGGPLVPNPIQSGPCLFTAANPGPVFTPPGMPTPPPSPGNGIDPNGITNLAPGRASTCVDTLMEKLVNTSGTPAGSFDPLPNGGLTGPDNNVGTFFSDSKQRVSDNYATVRGDLKISDKDSLSGSWYRDHSSWTLPNSFNYDISGFLVPHAAYTLEENHVFSPAMVNTLRVGLNQSDLNSPSISTSNPLELDTTLGVMPGCVAPGVNIGAGGLSANSATADGFGGFTTAPGFYAKTAILQLFDDVARTAGKHSLKFGFMYLGDHQDWGQGAGCSGSSSFDSIPSFLQNIPHQVRMPTVPPFTSGPTTHHYRSKIFAGYVQDDWKVRPNLTLNFGLRYEMQTIPTETQGKINQLEQLYQNPNANGGPCMADSNGLATCAGFYHTTFGRNPTKRNFEPRVGFAWDPFKTGKTSVRGGFGLFDVLPLPYMFALNSLQTAPNGAEVDLSCGLGLQCNEGAYPVGFTNLATGVTPSAKPRYGYNEHNPHRDYVMQWNLNIQRQVTSSTSVTLAYTGAKGVHNPFQTDELNTVYPTKTSAGWLFPNPIGSGCLPGPPDCSATDAALGLPAGFAANPTAIVPGLLINAYTADIQSTIFQAESWYEALQVKVDKRLSHGFQLGGALTWGKSFDTSSSSFAGDNYSNNITPTIPWWDLSITKGLSDFNVTRNLVVNGLWQVPTPASFSGPAGWIARGWELGGVFEVSDGTPLWTLDGVEGDPMGQLNGEPMGIPDRVPGCALTNPSSGRHGALQYINPNCFIPAQAPSPAFFNANCDQNPPYGPGGAKVSLASLGVPPLTCFNLLGNLGRNTVIGPGLVNVDADLTKDTHIKKISEAFDIQFRAEFFNIVNRTNFAPPKANNLEPISAAGTPQAGFGVLKATQIPNREIQFALKMIW